MIFLCQEILWFFCVERLHDFFLCQEVTWFFLCLEVAWFFFVPRGCMIYFGAKRLHYFQGNGPQADSFIELRCQFICPLFMSLFSMPLIGPQITWSDPGLSFVDPPPSSLTPRGCMWFFDKIPLDGGDNGNDNNGGGKKLLSANFWTQAETKIVVLLSALVERFFVCRMQDF